MANRLGQRCQGDSMANASYLKVWCWNTCRFFETQSTLTLASQRPRRLRTKGTTDMRGKLSTWGRTRTRTEASKVLPGRSHTGTPNTGKTTTTGLRLSEDTVDLQSRGLRDSHDSATTNKKSTKDVSRHFTEDTGTTFQHRNSAQGRRPSGGR